MFLIRDVFRCKPGKAGALAAMFKKTVASMESQDGFANCGVPISEIRVDRLGSARARVDDDIHHSLGLHF